VSNKPILIVLGEPYSIFSETLFKLYKSKIYKKLKKPIILIGSKKLLIEQMLKLKFKYKINEIKYKDIGKYSIDKKNINIINVNFSYKKVFDKISNKSNNYIKKCFDIALILLKKNYAYALINGPISKKYFLNKKYLGITEYLTKKTNTKNSTMLIYNPSFSVCPITTHLPISKVSKSITSKKIIENILVINDFFIKKLNKKPNIAVLGLNPDCETINKISEEDKIIKPALKY
jgi:4-hydroxythreonine-4-phosphate dehydrogenase